MLGDRDASMHYKYIVDKVKSSKKGKRFLKLFDLCAPKRSLAELEPMAGMWCTMRAKNPSRSPSS